MRRREFIELLGGGSTAPAASCASQQPVINRHVSGGCWIFSLTPRSDRLMAKTITATDLWKVNRAAVSRVH